jgi:hypothetical protein
MIHPVKRRQFVHVAAQAVVAVGWGQEPQEQVPYYYGSVRVIVKT